MQHQRQQHATGGISTTLSPLPQLTALIAHHSHHFPLTTHPTHHSHHFPHSPHSQLREERKRQHAEQREREKVERQREKEQRLLQMAGLREAEKQQNALRRQAEKKERDAVRERAAHAHSQAHLKHPPLPLTTPSLPAQSPPLTHLPPCPLSLLLSLTFITQDRDVLHTLEKCVRKLERMLDKEESGLPYVDGKATVKGTNRFNTPMYKVHGEPCSDYLHTSVEASWAKRDNEVEGRVKRIASEEKARNRLPGGAVDKMSWIDPRSKGKPWTVICLKKEKPAFS